MGIFDVIKDRKKKIDNAAQDPGEGQAGDESHEEGTPRQNKRQCVDIDPVTKVPTFYDCEDE